MVTLNDSLDHVKCNFLALVFLESFSADESAPGFLFGLKKIWKKRSEMYETGG